MKKSLLAIATKSILTVAIIATATVGAFAQRFCYVDANKVLERVPEYKTAQDQLDQTAEKWKQDVAAEYAKVDEMYRKYQADEVLLDATARKQREDEITAKEKNVRDLQKQKFGPEGALNKKRQELVKPIQDKVYAAIEQYASEKGYEFIFDKASMTGMLFANPKQDKTDDIVKKLGY
jgi:outer membrane protein